jgi:hypothetical protein
MTHLRDVKKSLDLNTQGDEILKKNGTENVY